VEPWNQRAHHFDTTKDPPRKNTVKNLKTVEWHHPEYQQQNYDYQQEQSLCGLQEQASESACISKCAFRGKIYQVTREVRRSFNL